MKHFGAARIGRWGLWLAALGTMAAMAPAQAQPPQSSPAAASDATSSAPATPLAATPGASAYVACLGCAEHREIEARWRAPFLAAVAAQADLASAHFVADDVAAHDGLCETSPLMRSPNAIDGCHAFSLPRALLIAAPLEIVVFTSPAWGLARSGHPRWAMLLEALPIAYHAAAIGETIHAVHQWQRIESIYR